MRHGVNTRRMIRTERQRDAGGAWEAVPPIRSYDPPGWVAVFLGDRPAIVSYGWVNGMPLLQRAVTGEVIANLTEGAVQLPGPSGVWRWRVV